MTSKIINMADRIKDDQDRLLESLFSAPPISDDGFGRVVMRRIRRRLWLRRLVMPTAVAVGTAIALKPMVQLVTMLAGVVQIVPGEFSEVLGTQLPQLWMVVLGAMLLAACMLGLRTIEE